METRSCDNCGIILTEKVYYIITVWKRLKSREEEHMGDADLCVKCQKKFLKAWKAIKDE